MTTRNEWMAVGALAAMLAALTGCGRTSGTTVVTDHHSGSSEILEDSTRLRRQIEVLRVNYDEVNGMKRVHITLASTRHRRLRVDYRILWLDANGMEIDPDTRAYRHLILEGRDAVTVTGVANSPAAVTSRMRVRSTSVAD